VIAASARRIVSWLPFGWVREIPRETGRYLTRWSIRRQLATGGGGRRAYLHRFWSGDSELHNHPWRWSFSIILWGSYTEIYADVDAFGQLGPIQRRRVRWFNWIPSTRYHQILELHPSWLEPERRFGHPPAGGVGRVWTLFVCGPKHNLSWGFWVPGRGFVHHTRRKQERGLSK
jgi:hypothetical protein